MANNESKVLTTNSFEEWRRASNEVSYHLGDIDQFDARIGDKVYTYSASADQQFFIGADSGSKILRFELAAEVPIDVTSTIIFDHITPPTIASNWVAGNTVYQGSVGSETFTGVILYVNKAKVALTSTTGTFSASADLKQTTDSTTQTIAHADLIRSISESYTTSYAKVYNGSTEQAQSTAQVGFHVPNLAYTIVLNGTPAVLASFSEGAKVYQGTNWGSRVWEGTILKTTTGNVYLKSYSEDPRGTGTTTAFNTGAILKEESDSGSDRIIAARITSGAAVDTTFGTIIELHTLASASAAIKLISTGAVDAIKELQDDIGTVESLTTSATDLQAAINEHESDIGNMTFTGLSATDISAGLRELRTELGNHASLGTTHTADAVGAINELETAVRGSAGNYTINTAANDLVAAINEHESDIGNMTLTNLTATNLSAAARELRTELGDVTTINDATGYAATDASAGILEIQADLGNVTASNMGTTASTVVGAILENQTEIGVIGSLAAGITSDRTNLVAAVNELQGDIGVAAISGLSATTLRGAVNELRTELGDVGAIDDATGYAATTAVTGLTEIQGKIGNVTAGNMGTTASTVVTAISELHTDVDASVRLTSGSSQTLNFDMTYGSNGKSMTFASGTTLDLSNATLLLSAAGNVANFGSAFLNLDATEASGSNVNLQGLQVDRSSISGGAPTHDVRLQWDETRVANDPEEAWELQGMATDKSSNTSSIVTRYNAFNLFNGSTQTGLGFSWDSTNERFNVVLDNSTFALTGDVTGSATQTAKGNVSIATSMAANSVDLTTHTTGNYVATITGTANEITVSGSGTEGRAVTLALPDDVTIGDDLTVTDALSVGGASTLTGNTTIGGTLQVNGNVTLGNAASDTVTVTGDLIVQGDETKLNTATLEVEDTLVVMGTAGAEPTTGGFGIETRLFTSTSVHSPAASNITGTHSLVYNFATDQWEADGSLVLSSATNTPATIESISFGAGKNLDFINGTGITAATSATGNDIDVTITNTDRGSQQNIWKTITADSGGSAAANSNTDTLTISGGTSLASARSGDTITVNHNNIGAGAATYGPTGSVTGVYIKSVIVDAQGHVTAVTTDDFDSRYNMYVHPTHPGDDASIDTGVLSGATVINDLDFNVTTDTLGHVTDVNATVGTRSLNLHELADTDWGSGGSEPADAAIAIYEANSNTWRDYVLSGDASMSDSGVVTVANNSHSHTYSNISDPPTIGNGTLTVTAGIGLTGGGTFTANQSGNTNRTLDLTFSGLTTLTSFAASDKFYIMDDSDNDSVKAINFSNMWAHIFNQVSGDGSISTTGVLTVNNDSHTHDYSNIPNTPTIGNATITLTAGAGLTTGGDFTTNQTGAETITFDVDPGDYITTAGDKVNVDATSANTASKVVARDGSGDFSAGTITATLSGSASSLTTARNIGGVSFNGTANINLPGVNTSGTQDTSGNAATVTNGVYTTGNQTIGGTKTFSSVCSFHSSQSANAKWLNTDNNTQTRILFTVATADGSGPIYHSGGLTVNSSSNIFYATDFVASSDERLKIKVGTLDNALDKICSLDGFLYTWNDKAESEDKETVQVGVSAQQVQEVLPEAVDEGDDGYLGVKYDKLVPLLIESIKELKAEVEELKSINS